ncbi:MAG: type III PLP-dependent enzyme [Streptosporangiales bacterium]|nr:type III PLP-dependent enzyme [Streptosporangiales bacterium]
MRLAAAGPGAFPAYVHDLATLARHAAEIRAALPRAVGFTYAVKANPDPGMLRALAPYLDGLDVTSGGELRHVTDVVPGLPVAFGGPGKTDAELGEALRLGVRRIHVESPHELHRLAAAARTTGRQADILLRADLPLHASEGASGPAGGASAGSGGEVLRMGGVTPFGMDPAGLDAAVALLPELPELRLRGFSWHLASGLDADTALAVAAEALGHVRPRTAALGLREPEYVLGGGMEVDYAHPDRHFDWTRYGAGLAALALPGERLRIEPGRAVTAYCGWYLTRVIDVKHAHGTAFGILHGGTHHLRTPVTKGHDQPFAVLPAHPAATQQPGDTPSGGDPQAVDEPITLTGQLCTPKDVFARNVPVDRLRAGDVVAFAMAGAYAWNISHHDFCLHDPPEVHYLHPPA